jgi:hypothetical protein
MAQIRPEPSVSAGKTEGKRLIIKPRLSRKVTLKQILNEKFQSCEHR